MRDLSDTNNINCGQLVNENGANNANNGSVTAAAIHKTEDILLSQAMPVGAMILPNTDIMMHPNVSSIIVTFCWNV